MSDQHHLETSILQHAVVFVCIVLAAVLLFYLSW